ncbi:MAG: metal-sensitive transcriptional regulator [Anaerolineales bacterium]|nr:metal-sensitive transcriptional regulator [Anaerolineales bacterium]
MDKQDTLRRLKSVEGHIRGIERMVESDAYCIDLIRQIQAVQGALNKITTNVLDDHLRSCLISAVRGDDADERERVLEEIREVYEMATKV